MADNIHEGIINLSSACEIVSTRYIERKNMNDDLRVKQVLSTKQSFATRCFHEVTLHIDGQSLKTQDLNTFNLLEKAYKTRNNLVHKGGLVYKDVVSGMTTIVTRFMANDFFRGCEHAVEWIENL